jgi:hypothetical protein
MVWRWTADGTYSSRSASRALYSASHPITGCKRIWTTWTPLRVKVFLWLAPCGTLKTLDCRPTDTAQPRCTRSLLPMQPGAGDDRPYRSVVFLLRADLVEHPGGTRCRHFPSGQGHPPFLVELMAGALDERQKAGSRLSVCACSVRVVVKREKGRCFRNVSCMILQLLAHIKFADQCIDPGTAKLGCLLRE